MSEAYWYAVADSGMAVPSERPLADSAAELVHMLGSPRSEVRDGLAFRLLSAWLASGTFDQSLESLGDGIITGLGHELGREYHDSIYRRSYSALLLGHIIGRDNDINTLSSTTILRWGDISSNWLLREKDLRGWTVEHGWANAMAFGGDLLAALVSSRHVGGSELAVLLDVLGERLTQPTQYVWRHGEPDRLAFAAAAMIHRNLLDFSALEMWLESLCAASCRSSGDTSKQWPSPTAHNVKAFVRGLQLQLALGVQPRTHLTGNPDFFNAKPHQRGDIILLITDCIKATDPWLFRSAST